MVKDRIIIGLIVSIVFLNGGDNVYLGDSFNARHSKAKESFNRTMAKNRAYSHIGNSSYTEVNGKEEFKKALESGKLNQKIDTNKITKTYRAIDIKNVRINRDDFKNINGDRVVIGSQIDKDREKLMQTVSIKNSKIETDKQLNVGVVSTSDKVSGVDTVTNIQNSTLKGVNKRKDETMSRLKMFEELENANDNIR